MRLGHKQSGFPGKHARKWAARSIFAGMARLFPNSEVFGADIDRGVLFDEDRIRTYYVDQLDPKSITSMWSSIGAMDFDLIVDDGLHTFDGGRRLFEYSFEKARPSGLYVIEDVAMPDMRRFSGTSWSEAYRPTI